METKEEVKTISFIRSYNENVGAKGPYEDMLENIDEIELNQKIPKNTPALTLYMIRHGPSCANLSANYCKWLPQRVKSTLFSCRDPLLSNWPWFVGEGGGKSRSVRTAQQLRDMEKAINGLGPLDGVYSSFLLRAIETARMLFPHQKITPFPHITEIGIGAENNPLPFKEQKQILANNRSSYVDGFFDNKDLIDAPEEENADDDEDEDQDQDEEKKIDISVRQPEAIELKRKQKRKEKQKLTKIKDETPKWLNNAYIRLPYSRKPSYSDFCKLFTEKIWKTRKDKTKGLSVAMVTHGNYMRKALGLDGPIKNCAIIRVTVIPGHQWKVVDIKEVYDGLTLPIEYNPLFAERCAVPCRNLANTCSKKALKAATSQNKTKKSKIGLANMNKDTEFDDEHPYYDEDNAYDIDNIKYDNDQDDDIYESKKLLPTADYKRMPKPFADNLIQYNKPSSGDSEDDNDDEDEDQDQEEDRPFKNTMAEKIKRKYQSELRKPLLA